MAGVASSFSSASVIVKVLLLLAFVDLILTWVSFTTASWAREFSVRSDVSDFHTGLGLWRTCASGTASGRGLIPACNQIDGTNIAYFGVIQAFVSIGFLGVNAMFLILFISIFSEMCSSVTDINKVNGIQAIITSVFFLIGIIIFGAKYGDGKLLRQDNLDRNGDLGYSFIVAVFAMVLELVCGVLLLVSGKGGGATGST